MTKKTLLLFVVAAAILTMGAGCATSATSPVTDNSSDKQNVKFNCEQSGGLFVKSNCECPTEPAAGEGGPAYTYETSTGYCVNYIGFPGGARGDMERKLQEAQKIKNK